MGDEAGPPPSLHRSQRGSASKKLEMNAPQYEICFSAIGESRGATRAQVSTSHIPMEPVWSLPAQHSIEDIETLECWGIGAACRSSNASDLEVEIHTDDACDLFVFLDLEESDDASMDEEATMADLNDAWVRRRQHVLEEIPVEELLRSEQTGCEDETKYCEALEMNATLSNGWHRMRESEAEKPEKTDGQGGEEQELAVAIVPPKKRSLEVLWGHWSYEFFQESGWHPPITWRKPHWKQHAATLKYFEYIQQHCSGDPGEDLRLKDEGVEVPTYAQTRSGSCTWDVDNACFWCWRQMVAQIDDTIVRDRFTDLQYVCKGQCIEACTVGTNGGFSLWRNNETSVRLVPHFRNNEIWATEYNQGVQIRSSRRMMRFDLSTHRM